MIRVAAEGRDVAPYPEERRALVEQRVVARRVMGRLLRQLRVRHEAEDAEAVVDREGDDSLRSHRSAVLSRLVPGARDEAAAVEVYEHGQTLFAGLGGSPYV